MPSGGIVAGEAASAGAGLRVGGWDCVKVDVGAVLGLVLVPGVEWEFGIRATVFRRWVGSFLVCSSRWRLTTSQAIDSSDRSFAA